MILQQREQKPEVLCSFDLCILIGHTGSPIRSPLKEKNDTPSVRGRSPIKTTYSSPSKITSSPRSKMSPSKFNSPVRTGTFKVQKKTEETPTTSTSYRTLYEVIAKFFPG